MKTGLKITDCKGFHLSFDNGLIISVQFGYGNYCGNRFDNRYLRNRMREYNIECECPDAEVAIFKTNSKDNKWLTNKFLPKSRGVDVVGWVRGQSKDGILVTDCWVKGVSHDLGPGTPVSIEY